MNSDIHFILNILNNELQTLHLTNGLVRELWVRGASVKEAMLPRTDGEAQPPLLTWDARATRDSLS